MSESERESLDIDDDEGGMQTMAGERGSKPIALSFFLIFFSLFLPTPNSTHRSKDVMKLVYGRDEGVAQRAIDIGHCF